MCICVSTLWANVSVCQCMWLGLAAWAACEMRGVGPECMAWFSSMQMNHDSCRNVRCYSFAGPCWISLSLPNTFMVRARLGVYIYIRRAAGKIFHCSKAVSVCWVAPVSSPPLSFALSFDSNTTTCSCLQPHTNTWISLALSLFLSHTDRQSHIDIGAWHTWCTICTTLAINTLHNALVDTQQHQGIHP